VLDAFNADAIDTQELKREYGRIALQRAALQSELEKFNLDEATITRALERCLELLSIAHEHYKESDDLGRRELNQAVFEHLYIDDDKVRASDLEPAFHKLMSDTLSAVLESERKTEQTMPVRTRDLYLSQG